MPSATFEAQYVNFLAHLEFGEVLEQGLVDCLLTELGGKHQHALQRQLPQICIAVGKAVGHMRKDLILHHTLQQSNRQMLSIQAGQKAACYQTEGTDSVIVHMSHRCQSVQCVCASCWAIANQCFHSAALPAVGISICPLMHGFWLYPEPICSRAYTF